MQKFESLGSPQREELGDNVPDSASSFDSENSVSFEYHYIRLMLTNQKSRTKIGNLALLEVSGPDVSLPFYKTF